MMQSKVLHKHVLKIWFLNSEIKFKSMQTILNFFMDAKIIHRYVLLHVLETFGLTFITGCHQTTFAPLPQQVQHFAFSSGGKKPSQIGTDHYSNTTFCALSITVKGDLVTSVCLHATLVMSKISQNQST